jgi:hypothetical protein
VLRGRLCVGLTPRSAPILVIDISG